jgi:hypothetical protein
MGKSTMCAKCTFDASGHRAVYKSYRVFGRDRAGGPFQSVVLIQGEMMEKKVVATTASVATAVR